MLAKLPQLCPTLCDPMDRGAHQAPRSIGFSRQDYQSGLPCLPSRDLPDPGIKLMSLMSPALYVGMYVYVCVCVCTDVSSGILLVRDGHLQWRQKNRR